MWKQRLGQWDDKSFETRQESSAMLRVFASEGGQPASEGRYIRSHYFRRLCGVLRRFIDGRLSAGRLYSFA